VRSVDTDESQASDTPGIEGGSPRRKHKRMSGRDITWGAKKRREVDGVLQKGELAGPKGVRGPGKWRVGLDKKRGGWIYSAIGGEKETRKLQRKPPKFYGAGIQLGSEKKGVLNRTV